MKALSKVDKEIIIKAESYMVQVELDKEELMAIYNLLLEPDCIVLAQVRNELVKKLTHLIKDIGELNGNRGIIS